MSEQIIRLPLNLKNGNEEEEIAVACFDRRMGAKFVLFFEIYLRTIDFFRLNFPGGAKLINERPEIIPLFFDTPILESGATRITILDHEDCLAWGGSKSFASREAERAKHEDELRQARLRLMETYPDKNLKIKMFYAEIGTFKRGPMLNFIRVWP